MIGVDRGGFVFNRDAIVKSADTERVTHLPAQAAVEPALVDSLSKALRARDDAACPECTDGCSLCGWTGKIMLRDRQAQALREFYETGGLFAHMPVGEGKTLVSLLAPTLVNAERPVLMVPAALREKTHREFAVLRRAWRVRLPRIVGYEEMGRADRETLLIDLAPDLLILDEAHRIRNMDSAVTRRVKRAIGTLRPRTMMLSGTLITEQFADYWHQARWSLWDSAPVPRMRVDAERWGQAIDGSVGTLRRLGLGALPDNFPEHFRTRKGVVVGHGSGCDAAIYASTWAQDLPDNLRKMVEATAVSGLRPDNELLDQWEQADCLCQLALGFYYVWDPLPPAWWLEPRRAWRSYVREVLETHTEGFDSEGQIALGLDGYGRSPPGAATGRSVLAAWRAVKDKFTPNPVPVWITTDSLREIADMYRRDGRLIWLRYRAAGAMLERFGVPYYPGGTDPQSAVPGSTIALSIASHGTGRNMQAWHKSLVLTPMANAEAWEQLVGRTHRFGQKSDVVRVAALQSIGYHADVMERVKAQARAIERASGVPQKLNLATWEDE